MDLPAGMLETILEYRAYARAKQQYDARGRTAHDSPLTDLVVEIDFAIVTADRHV